MIFVNPVGDSPSRCSLLLVAKVNTSLYPLAFGLGSKDFSPTTFLFYQMIINIWYTQSFPSYSSILGDMLAFAVLPMLKQVNSLLSNSFKVIIFSFLLTILINFISTQILCVQDQCIMKLCLVLFKNLATILSSKSLILPIHMNCKMVRDIHILEIWKALNYFGEVGIQFPLWMIPRFPRHLS